MMTLMAMKAKNFFRKLRKEDGQAMVEYGLIIALIAVAVIAVLVLLGDDLVAMFTKVGDKL